MEAIRHLHQAAVAEQERTTDLLLSCCGEYLLRVWGGGVRKRFSASESRRRWGRAGDSSTHGRLLFSADATTICRRVSFSDDQLFHRDFTITGSFEGLHEHRRRIRQSARQCANAFPLPVSNYVSAIHAPQRDIKDRQISGEITWLHYNISTLK